MIIGVTGWLLSCGHAVRMTATEIERSQTGTLELPRRPRMCPVCQRPRNVEDTARNDGSSAS